MKRGNSNVIISCGFDPVVRKDILDALRCSDSVRKALTSKGFEVETFFLNRDDFESEETIKAKILDARPFCVFNLFEGFSDAPQKEADFVRILEGIDIPFTGNPSSVLRLCLDKGKVKEILEKENVPVPRGVFIKRLEDLYIDVLSFPCFIKPCSEDASLGIDRDSLVLKREGLDKIVESKLKEFPLGLLIEEFISGKEYNVGLLGDFPYEALGVSVIDYSQYENLSPYLTYSAKWEVDSPEFNKISPEVMVDKKRQEKMIALAKKAGKILGCRGYFRVDLREKEGKLFVLDVNPNPDINEDSGFIRQVYSKGYTYEDIIERISLLAIKP